jgi:hypothetical protein
VIPSKINHFDVDPLILARLSRHALGKTVRPARIWTRTSQLIFLHGSSAFLIPARVTILPIGLSDSFTL